MKHQNNQFLSMKILILAIFILQAINSQHIPKLQMVQVLFRHGARYPTQVLGVGDQFAQQQRSLGQLTSNGKRMLYLLGKRMREIYWDRLFGGTPFEFRYNQSKFYVQSTNYNRTIESAQSYLYGLFEHLPPLVISEQELQYSNPPFPGAQSFAGMSNGILGPVFGRGSQFHPIAIHMTNKFMSQYEEGDFLARWDSKQCPEQAKWVKQNFNQKIVKNILKDQAYIKILKQFQQAIEKTVTFQNFMSYYDDLVSIQHTGNHVPSILNKTSESKRVLDSLFAVTYFISTCFNFQQLRTSASQFIGETLKNIKSVQKNATQNRQWLVYSAHDNTVAQVLGLLNLTNPNCIYNAFKNNITKDDKCILHYPAYAASLTFELYSHGPQYKFKINYNGEHKKIPFCNYAEECAVEVLEAEFEKWKISDIKSACGFPYYYTKQAAYSLIGAVLLFIFWSIISRIKSSKIKSQ